MSLGHSSPAMESISNDRGAAATIYELIDTVGQTLYLCLPL